MKLDHLLSSYPYIHQAALGDDGEIIDFLNSISMDLNSFSLHFDRAPSFFTFAKEQSDKTYTLLMRNESLKIKGIASIVLIDHFINQKKECCAYLCDLRISPQLSPRIRVQWKKCYGDLISNFSKIDEFKDVRYLYSAILDENEKALRSLLKNNSEVIYHQLNTYQAYHVFLQKPFTTFKPSAFYLTNENDQNIKAFLSKNAQGEGMNDFFTDNQSDELDRRFFAWENFSYASFLVVKNQENKIIACCAPKISDSKKLVIKNLSFLNKFLGYLLPIFKIPKIIENKPIDILYLTHLKFDFSLTPLQKKEIIILFLQDLLKRRNKKFHLISFFQFTDWELPAIPFYFQKTKGRFYQVMNRSTYEKNDFIDLKNKAPAFEIGIS